MCVYKLLLCAMAGWRPSLRSMTPAPHLGHARLLGHFDLAEGTSLAQLQEAYHIHAKGMYTDIAGDGAASDLKQIQEGYEEAQRMLRIHGEAGLAQGTSSDGGRGEPRYDDQRQSRSTEGRGVHFDPGYASYKNDGFNAYTEGDVRFDPAACASKAEEVVVGFWQSGNRVDFVLRLKLRGTVQSVSFSRIQCAKVYRSPHPASSFICLVQIRRSVDNAKGASPSLWLGILERLGCGCLVEPFKALLSPWPGRPGT